MELTPARLNSTSIVNTLRKTAETNKAFNAMCHMFAIRERARQQITIESLVLRMAQEGYRHTKKEYQDALKYLADLGIGTIDLHPKTKEVRALKGIKVTLQSLGKAALAQQSSMENFTQPYEYAQLQFEEAPAPEAVVAAPVAPPPAATRGHIVTLVTSLKGEKIELPLPRELTTQELGELVIMLSSKRSV